ncbi:type I restriction enzyme HsdR N-terminal domain-containing protein [Vermiculatibacterium agrestimuris]|uniref:type I restriction enzyme HsdR N-terminal domain-containing protein n=1 Tax=Vermiculatibacterium agrestimuris TaxID=2941519 RepID=UPI00203D116F|nr:type I restriction enzyme HsdR N-terminal domain-containing protein [Vermiculatibacterium agrestimuris]
MVTIPAKVKERLIAGAKRFQPIIKKARDKDINESDTVTIISDILSDVFGYDKYTEITSEYAIKKTYCDLAIKIDGVPKLLIEAKAAGLDLKDQHIKQAVDYGSNSGIEWVVLTNGVNWKVYNIIFGKPVSAELVYDFDFSTLNPKKQNELEMLYYLSREAMTKGNKTYLDEYHTQQQLVNKVTIAQILLSEPALDMVRRTIRKMSPDAKVSNDEISSIIAEEIIKRDVLDDERAADAKKKVAKALKPAAKSEKPAKSNTPTE